jgi:hypothetical protein
MVHVKDNFLKVFCLLFFALFLFSCHSNNSVISSWGKRKYMKGYYWNKHGEPKAQRGSGSDSIHKNKVKAATVPEKETVVPPSTNQPTVVEVKQPKHKHHCRNKDSIRQSRLAEKAFVAASKKDKVKPPPEPDNSYFLRLLILIIVLTGLALFTTGLITPIAIWGITQDFLLISGVFVIFFGLFISVDQKLGINRPHNKISQQSNTGKPAFSLSWLAAIIMAFVFAVVKTSLDSDLMNVQIATLGMFFAGVCVLLSLILAFKALFVQGKYTWRAVSAMLIDMLLITVSLLFLF